MTQQRPTKLAIHALLPGLCLFALAAGCSSSTTEPNEADSREVAVAPAKIVADEDESQPEAASPAAGAQEIELTTATYEQVMGFVEQQRGRVVVVDVWSTSCVPCMQEFPYLIALSSEFPDVQCVSVNLDYLGLKKKPVESYVPKVQAFLEKQNATIKNFIAADSGSDETLQKFDVAALPAILVFDQAGNVHRFTDDNASGEGVSYAADVVPTVEKLLADATQQ